MGNSSSKSRSSDISNISSPKYLLVPNDAALRRRSSTALTPSSGLGNFLSVPGAGTHRRSRSALAGSSRNTDRYSAPPPPYSVASAMHSQPDTHISLNVPTPSSAEIAAALGASVFSAPVTSLGSSHTQFLSLPPSNRGGEDMSVNNATENRRRRVDHSELRRPLRTHSVENALDTLRKFNTVIVVDDSGSMQGERWRETRDVIATLADIAARYDADGIDVCFLNSKRNGQNMKNPEMVRDLFDSVRPLGITPIGEKLESLLLWYMNNLERAKLQADAGDPRLLKALKPVNYIIITDGSPTDDPEEVIVATARRLDANNFPLSQLGIQFVQIGDNLEATQFLNELDDGLAQRHNIRDIVDTTPYTGGQLTADMIIKILLGGINRRVDRRGGQSVIGS